jgi:hypothetical protein
MGLIPDPETPLRDTQLSGVLLALVRLIASLRTTAGVVLAVTYFQTWQIQGGVARSGFALSGHSPLPVLTAAGLSALGFWLLRAPSLARGMLSAAGTVALALTTYWLTRNTSAAPVGDAVLRPAQVVFGFTFIGLTFTSFLDLLFQPILYMWQRSADGA